MKTTETQTLEIASQHKEEIKDSRKDTKVGKRDGTTNMCQHEECSFTRNGESDNLPPRHTTQKANCKNYT